jgi:hypothetical protein
MKAASKRKTDQKGARGGNRGGDRTRAAKQVKKSSQAAGKDPTRGKGRSD